METLPHITSFVIRFVQEDPDKDVPSYRVHIRHVQSNRECNFAHWSDAIGFMQEVLPVGLDSLNRESFDGE